jgi:hypothetical protein
VSGTAQLMHQGRADETVSADQKDSHKRLDESVSIPVCCECSGIQKAPSPSEGILCSSRRAFSTSGQFVGKCLNTL